MTAAAQLDLFAPRAAAPKPPDDPDARTLVQYLYAVGDWRKRSDIEQDLGFDDRRLRSARHEARRLIFSCTKGFKHILRATPQERREAIDFYGSQGLDMLSTKADLESACRELGCEVLAASGEWVPA